MYDGKYPWLLLWVKEKKSLILVTWILPKHGFNFGLKTELDQFGSILISIVVFEESSQIEPDRFYSFIVSFFKYLILNSINLGT